MNYDMPLYRPPSEGNNLIIQATLGCSFNQCSFCSMYLDKQYVERPLKEVFSEIQLASSHWPDAHRVFLADGDALALPTDHLLAILEELHSSLPKLSRVSCYATPSNIQKKSPQELETLKQHGLTLLYLGIESGSDLILKKITKGATQKSIRQAMTKAYDAGLKVSGTIVLGLGGEHYWQQHIDGTAELLSSAPITFISTLQLHLEPRMVAEFKKKFAEPFRIPDDNQILDEQVRFISQVNPPKPVIFRSNHASNALALAGNLPRDKERLLQQLDQAITGNQPLRPNYMRGL